MTTNPGQPGPDPALKARTGTMSLVFDLLRARYGTEAVIDRPIGDRPTLTVFAPADYTAGVAAARMVAAHAHELINHYARNARSEGHSWRDLADPLGVDTDDAYVDPAVAAFEMIAGKPSMRFDPLWTSWRCVTCGELVTDHGPYNGHPTDCETGHDQACARHQAEVAAYLVAIGH